MICTTPAFFNVSATQAAISAVRRVAQAVRLLLAPEIVRQVADQGDDAGLFPGSFDKRHSSFSLQTVRCADWAVYHALDRWAIRREALMNLSDFFHTFIHHLVISVVFSEFCDKIGQFGFSGKSRFPCRFLYKRHRKRVPEFFFLLHFGTNCLVSAAGGFGARARRSTDHAGSFDPGAESIEIVEVQT